MTTSSSSSKAAKSVNLFKHELGTGTWSWGDRLFWGFGKDYGEEDSRSVFDESIKSGVTFFDTAEIYGTGESERLLGKFLKSATRPVIIASKFMPYPWRINRDYLRRALKGSLKRLGLSSIHLYQIHWPYPPVPITTWLEGMAELQQEGLIKAVGVSNYNLSQTETAIRALDKFGLKLASNQVEYHLLDRTVEKNGLLSLCKQEGIRLIAYSPLAQGLLTGKYSPENPPGGIRRSRFHNQLQTISPLISALRKLGDQHDGKTPAAVAINWTIRKGTLPIPGAKTMLQMNQNASALGWKLNEEEVAHLDEVSEACQLGL
jgi:aryl-alcohol dehydrogenase-like predicted oxidoreductase